MHDSIANVDGHITVVVEEKVVFGLQEGTVVEDVFDTRDGHDCHVPPSYQLVIGSLSNCGCLGNAGEHVFWKRPHFKAQSADMTAGVFRNQCEHPVT